MLGTRVWTALIDRYVKFSTASISKNFGGSMSSNDTIEQGGDAAPMTRQNKNAVGKKENLIRCSLSRTMAQIIPRGNNKWLVRIFLRRTAEAKKEFHNKVVHGTKKDAQKYARETETKRDLGTLDKPIIEDPTLNDFLDDWLIAFKQKTVRERTYAGYKSICPPLPRKRQVI
jgi:lysophospholipase L1-like esterase